MSANLKVASFDSGTLAYKIVSDTTLDATANIDVTAEAGSLYAIDIDNQDQSDHCFVKLSLTQSTITVGTTPPDIMIRANSATKRRVVIPEGVAFSKLSFWQTTLGTDASSSTAASPVLVTLVTS
jgi:hypothetical protein